jgi:hypothetical protein
MHAARIEPRRDDGTAANLRVVCAAHNRLAARPAFGNRYVERYAEPSTA